MADPSALHENPLSETLCLWTYPPNTYPAFKFSLHYIPIFWLQNQFLSHRAYATQDKQIQQTSSPAFSFLGPISLGAPLPSESTRLKTSRVTFTSPSLSFSNPQGSPRPAACLPNTFHFCVTLTKPTANFLDWFFIISYHTVLNLPVLIPPPQHHSNLRSGQSRLWKTSLDFFSPWSKAFNHFMLTKYHESKCFEDTEVSVILFHSTLSYSTTSLYSFQWKCFPSLCLKLKPSSGTLGQ